MKLILRSLLLGKHYVAKLIFIFSIDYPNNFNVNIFIILMYNINGFVKLELQGEFEWKIA